MDIFTAGHARGERERAKRTQNANRVEAGKKQVRLAWKNLKKENKIAIESLEILKRNTNRVLDRQDAIATQDWLLGRENTLEEYEDKVGAYNKSVENYTEALNLIDINTNIAYEEENNYMDDFYTSMKYEALEAQYALTDTMTKAGFEAQAAQLDVQVAMSKGASERELIKLQNKAERETSAHESQQEQIQTMQDKGKLRASLGGGRTSRKALQVVDSQGGMRQAMRVDALLNRNSVFRNQLKASYDNLYYKKAGFRSKMDSIEAGVEMAQRDYNLSKAQASDTIQSALRANKTRVAKIEAGRYSDQINARNQVHSIPEPPKFDPVPWKAVRPEFQEIKKLTGSDQTKFYDQHMPHAEDENKIVGYEGRTPGWMTALQIGEQVATAAIAGFSGAPTTGPHAGSFSWKHAGASMFGINLPNPSSPSSQNQGPSYITV